MIVVEPDEVDGGFVAEAPHVPGALAQGETEQEAVENLGDAVSAIAQAQMDEQSRPAHTDVSSDEFQRLRLVDGPTPSAAAERKES